LTKHWDYNSVWSQLQPLLFWEGDTADIKKSKPDGDKEGTTVEETDD